jgi:hypothetical protein
VLGGLACSVGEIDEEGVDGCVSGTGGRSRDADVIAVLIVSVVVDGLGRVDGR